MKRNCDICGCYEEELYKFDEKLYCEYCLEKSDKMEFRTVETYYVNGEFFDEDEFYEALEYAGGEVVIQ